jgi:hypothetical protein
VRWHGSSDTDVGQGIGRRRHANVASSINRVPHHTHQAAIIILKSSSQPITAAAGTARHGCIAADLSSEA